ncbi:MAG: hypothetical protein OEO84_00535 [Betaproteobacteria bacterium]|nr:hypothetical protein [Betaproteobacteria bacterium]
MKRLGLVLVFLLAGCTHASVQMNSGGGAMSTTTSVSAGYSGHGSAAAWVLIGIGLVAAEYGGSQAARERGLEPEPAGARNLDASRQVNEQDCSKPIRDWSANLKCK